MFLIDDVLFAPIKFVYYIAKQVHKRAEEELLDEEGVRRELTDLYMMLETGRITEDEFEMREKALIERLEEIEEYKSNMRCASQVINKK